MPQFFINGLSGRNYSINVTDQCDAKTVRALITDAEGTGDVVVRTRAGVDLDDIGCLGDLDQATLNVTIRLKGGKVRTYVISLPWQICMIYLKLSYHNFVLQKLYKVKN